MISERTERESRLVVDKFYDPVICKYVSSAALSAVSAAAKSLPTLHRILSRLTREEIRTNLPTSRIEVDHKAISVGDSYPEAISGMGRKVDRQPTELGNAV
ncbi:orf100c (mitochondrion) [Beta vulgaris subsp. vulgaris]|uniref:Orf100c protein n=1 Tax=Beta vulgaris subsp. vulgaris TaxID=3555 RepID=Q9MF91_BETVV|nr:orf100c [Beta vulgaris subsp. vulgaris]BAA99359.1 orf100c [Beta vulgaris subsp. vulgaris]